MIRDEQFELGLELRRTMFGPAGSDLQIDGATEITEKVQEFVTRQCFGDVWQRDGLTKRERSLVTVAMLIALGRSHETSIHMRGGQANGATLEELREVVIQSIMYAGLPAAMDGLRALTALAEETRQS